MITNIKIAKYKSFHPTEAINIALETGTQKPVFFYGLNGAGKSAIGEVIDGCAKGDPQFEACRVDTTGTGPYRYLVYNHHFISSVIGEAEGMPGIFTIGEIDTATQKEIEEQERKSKEAELEQDILKQEIDTIDAALSNAVKLARDDVWKVFQAHDKGKLHEFLVGYGKDKKKFFEELRTYETPNDTPLDDIDTLAMRLADVSSDEAEKSEHNMSFAGLPEIEEDPIWRESIEISGESKLAPLIEKLGNGDWVSKGRLHIQDDLCPFCQQELPHDFLDELSKLLDAGRQAKMDAVAAHARNYAVKVEALEHSIGIALAEPLSKETSLRDEWGMMLAKMKANLASMNLKQERPSEPVSVSSTDCKRTEDALKALNQRIAEFNVRIADRKGEKSAIRQMFWKVMCRDRLSVYHAYDASTRPLNKQRAEVVSKDKESQLRQTACMARLAELRKKQTGVDSSVVMINQRLKGLGISSFWVARKAGDGSLYCLQRPGHDDCSAHSLSEGEKTLISFLYFMELLKGSPEEGQAFAIDKTIVVIDDPISSLSHNYVYDIASIICHELLKPPGGQRVKQVIVLTHSLFFLHELVYQLVRRRLANAAEKCQLLRVVKSSHTTVVPMNVRDCANDYDALWQVIQDAKDNRLPVQVVPNTLRCILEHFFAFTGRTDHFEEVLEKISTEDAKFKPLERYLNRGAHRDEINHAHIDWGQFDLDYYLAKLEAVFKAAGHDDHFQMKMRIRTA